MGIYYKSIITNQNASFYLYYTDLYLGSFSIYGQVHVEKKPGRHWWIHELNLRIESRISRIWEYNMVRYLFQMIYVDEYIKLLQ